METTDNIIVIKTGKEIVKYKILMSFEAKDNKYFVYTDNQVDDDGYAKAYAGIYKQDTKGQYLLPVENDEELMLIERLLTNLNKDGDKKNEE